jgi:hypothetical protein
VQLRAEEVDPEIPDRWVPRNPSQTPTKVAACEIAFGAKLCNSTAYWWHSPRMKRLAGAVKPRSWCRTKLTT